MTFDEYFENKFSALDKKIESLVELLNDSKNSRGSLKTYTSTDVCKMLNVTSRTLQTWRDLRLIEFFQIGNKIIYTEEQIDAFLKSHKIISKKIK